MKKSKRIVILAVVIELVLATIMAALYLQLQALAKIEPSFNEEAAARIGTAIGGAMGALGSFLLIYALLLYRRGD
jgi:hypothetical protein